MRNLKKCPFCGQREAEAVVTLRSEVPVFNTPSKAYHVQCPCGCSTKAYSRANTAVERWNRRVEGNKKTSKDYRR